MDSANHVSNEQGNCPVPVIPGNSVVQNLLNDSSQNLLDDSRFLSVPRFVGHHPMGESPALDGAHGSHEPSCRSCTTDAESFSLGSPSCYGVLEVADDASFEEQILPQASTPPRRESFSHLSLESTNESFVDIQALPNAIRSDLGSNGASGFPINGLDDEPTGALAPWDGRSSANISHAPGEKQLTAILPWKDPEVNQAEIPSSHFKPPISEVTDLGDRAFYAELNAKGRDSPVAPPRQGSEENLTLQEIFREAMVKIYAESKGFFPRALLSSLVTEACVFNELSNTLHQTHPQAQLQAYAETICKEILMPQDDDDNRHPRIKSFKKIFAILVLSEQTHRIIKFLEEDVNDLKLPLDKKLKGKNRTRFDLCLQKPEEESGGKTERKLECFQGWSPAAIERFEEWQWTMLAPFFHKGTRKDVQHFPLQGSVILPFTKDTRREDGRRHRTEMEGGQGRVFMVDIHPDHHNFDVPKGRGFAVKCLHSPNKVDFKNEVEMLKMFSDNAHPHLISLLATYEQFGVYYLIFPRADRDLNSFWKDENPRPSCDAKTIRWVAKQCMGIAQGLAKIHEYQTSDPNHASGVHEKKHVRHGDIKPENILWFSDDDGGILKISDFGLSESTNFSHSYKPNLQVAGASQSYRPPECDVRGAFVGRSWDIWTLGCLYLEFVTWLLGGWGLVAVFNNKRLSPDRFRYGWRTDTFFELFRNDNDKEGNSIGARVKPSVTQFINELYVHESCSQFLHDFIKLIETDLLIVKPSDRTQKGRMSSTQVCSKLAHMVRQCEDPDYLCRPAPSSATTAEVAPRHDSKNTTHFQGMLNQSWPTKKRSYSVYHCGNDMGSDSGME